MLRDNLVGLIEPMVHCARVTPLALRVLRTALPATPTHHRTIDPECLENPRPEGAEPSLVENVASPFHAEPRQISTRDSEELHDCPIGSQPPALTS
jgi:hypothetical protein